MGLKKIEMGKVASIFFLLCVIAIPFAYIHWRQPDLSFWDNAMGNMFATVLALIAGIPVALLIDRRIKSLDDKKQYLSNRKKEKEILELILEELEFSRNLFLKGRESGKSYISVQILKYDLWESLAEAGDLRFIENPKLLNRMASAYYVIKRVARIEEQAYSVLYTFPDKLPLNDGSGYMKPAELYSDDIQLFDNLLVESIKEALLMINRRLEQL